MKSTNIRKFIASALLLTIVSSLGTVSFNNKPASSKEIQSRDYDIFKGNISISEVITFNGTKAVTIQIPDGLMIEEADVDNEPHKHIDEVIIGNKVIIYGLREGVTYNNLVLTLESIMDVDYKYIINPFTIGTPSNNNGSFPGNNQGSINTPANTQAILEYLNTIYINVFNRQADQGGLTYWTAQLAQKLISLENFFKNLLVENEFLQIAPTTQDKIKKLYLGIFQREPDSIGFNFWVNKYNERLNQYGSEKAALVDIIDQMTDGVEFKILIDRLGVK